jgi:ketosteroid isomerase-like protein
MKKSFKIVYGYKRDEYIAITKSDLPKAYYSFLTDDKVIFSDGSAIRGKDIMRIEPNWNGVMGWNEDYIPQAEDFALIGGNRKYTANQLMISAKEIAKKSYENGDITLLETTPKLVQIASDNGKKLAKHYSIK